MKAIPTTSPLRRLRSWLANSFNDAVKAFWRK